jgi:hypothetical protein
LEKEGKPLKIKANKKEAAPTLVDGEVVEEKTTYEVSIDEIMDIIK